MKRSSLILFLTISCICTTWSQNIHVKLGLPDSLNVIYRNEYVLSFDQNKKIARWVSWYLDSTWFGSVKRYKGQFKPDQGVTHNDYTNSGYDRGHLCPSNERTRDVLSNENTFLMSNIVPQTKALNQGVWRNLEAFYERIARHKSVYIVAGTISHSDRWIKNKIQVPDSLYKIIVIFTNEIDSTTGIISVKMPNMDGIRKANWKDYLITIHDLEVSTGLNFLSNLPKELQEYLENKIYK